MRWFSWLGWWIATLLFCSNVFAQSAVVQQHEQCVVKIGDIRAYQSAEPANLTVFSPPSVDAPSQVVALPHNWSSVWPDYSGVVWYRIPWSWRCADNDVQHKPIGIVIRYISMAGAVMLNDHLIWRDDHFTEPLSRSWNRPLYFSIPDVALHSGENALWIRVIGLKEQAPGVGKVTIGNAQAQYDIYRQLTWQQRTLFLINLIVSVVFALIFTFIWWSYRSATANGWYALQTWCWIGFCAHLLMTEGFPFGSSLLIAKINAVFLAAFICTTNVFSWRFINKRWPWWERVMWLIFFISSSVLLITPYSWLQLLLSIWGPLFMLIYLGNQIWFIAVSIRSKETEHKLVAGCYLLFICLAINDYLILINVRSEDAIVLIPYGSIVTTVMITYLLAKRVANNMLRVTRFSEEMNEAVTRACGELNDQLTQAHLQDIESTRNELRQNFSHDLHDGVGGELVRSIALFEKKQGPLDQKFVLSLLKQMRDDLRGVLDSSANSSMQVPDSPRVWLAPLKQRFGNLFDELDIEHSWSISSAWHLTPKSNQCVTLGRVIEEALTNVVKHSRASTVQISVHYGAQNALVLAIVDDGVGFNWLDIQGSSMGIGLHSMQERVAKIGGQLAIDSAPGKTQLIATVPLHSYQ